MSVSIFYRGPVMQCDVRMPCGTRGLWPVAMQTLSGRAVLPLLLVLPFLCATATPPCKPELSVVVHSFSIADNGTLTTAWGASYTPGTYWKDGDGETRICACIDKPCLQKCCPEGQALGKGKCVDVDADPGEFRRRHANFQLLLYDSSCPCGRYLIPAGTYNLLSNGSLKESITNVYQPTDFCLDDYKDGEAALACFRSVARYGDSWDYTMEVVYQVYRVGIIISLPFMIATLLVYAAIPELRNLHGLSVISYVACLTVHYISVAVIQWNSNTISRTTCLSSAIITYFSLLASFFWLNVMCLDIFWTFSHFSGFRSLGGSVKEREFKKFSIYSIYSWGCPLIMLTVCLVMQFHEGISTDYLKPGFGIGACWFKDTMSAVAYLYGPVAVLILSNTILFILTVVKIAKLKREADMFNNSESQRHNDEDNKQGFNMYLKLFLVMGINLASDIIARTAGGPKYLWYLTDIANALQGVLIFIIFVWKDRIRKLLMERFCPKNLQQSLIPQGKSMKPDSKINQESLRMANMVISEESDVP